MLHLRVRKQFPERARGDGFTLDVDVGSDARVIGIWGPSGSGKTTLLNTVAGLATPDSGLIRVDDCVLLSTDERQTSMPIPNRRVGFVFQDGLLFPHLSIEKNLRYGHRENITGPGFDDVVDTLELGALLRRRPEEISGGEARRVAIGRALLSAPRILLLDEPLTGLDRRLARITLTFIRRTLDAFRIPTLYVSHSAGDIIFLADEAWRMASGRITEKGRPRAVVTSATPTGESAAEIENIFTAQVAPGSNEKRAAVFALGDQQVVTATVVPPGTTSATLGVPATDIILASSKPAGLSARNVLSATVTHVSESPGESFVHIDVGVEWVVRVTREAIAELSLHPGVEVFAIVKASAISVTPNNSI